MPGPPDDLLPMFVAEARERVERLVSSLAGLDQNPTALATLRRELHTLKGAARMLALTPIAELCHQGEDALQTPGPATQARLTELLDSLAAALDQLEQPSPSGPPASASTTTSAAPPAPRFLPGTGQLDAIVEQATRLRLLAVAAEGLTTRLDELARMAARASLEEHPQHTLALLTSSLRQLASEAEAGQRRLRRAAERQLDALLELQLEPLRPFLHFLARHARELARSLGREVDVHVAGEETRLDRGTVRELEEALLHLVRNAVDHGGQPPQERKTAGKPPVMRIWIQAEAVGQRVRLSVRDDGRGISPTNLGAGARKRGLVDPARAATLEGEQALSLLFLPGMSTREEISSVSGRGVGLDVVSAVATRLGGDVTVSSVFGEGTTFTLEVPVARRGEMVAVLRVAHLQLALPASVVRSCQWLPAEQVFERDGRLFARLGDAPLPFLSLAGLFGLPQSEPLLLVRGSVAGEELAVAAEALAEEVEVLVRPLPRAAAVAGGVVEGLALLPSGEPVPVLTPLRLLQAAHRSLPPQPSSPSPPRPAPRVLLADDSFVAREMERRLLEDAGFLVTTCGSGEEALARLGEASFDCLVTDIEMPGMDGLALTRALRGLPHLAHLPIVVVSTRDRPEDRLEGLQAGADAYLTKQRLEAGELVDIIRRLSGL